MKEKMDSAEAQEEPAITGESNVDELVASL